MEGLGLVWGRLVGVIRDGESYTRFSVTEGAGYGSLSSCCLVSLLDSKPLSPKRSQLTSSGSPSRYIYLTPGYWSYSSILIAKMVTVDQFWINIKVPAFDAGIVVMFQDCYGK